MKRKYKGKALDLFCCEGGTAEGLTQAGFEVTGVDIADERKIYYPFRFIHADALQVNLEGYDFIWASPPCQSFVPGCTLENKLMNPNLIPQIRERILKVKSLPAYVIENVQTCNELVEPYLLCGQMFNLNVIRHRLFESNFYVKLPYHPEHNGLKEMSIAKICGVYNHFHREKENWTDAMQVNHVMSKFGLKEAIPPAYSKWIADQYFGVKKGIDIMRDSYVYSRHVSKRILFYLKRYPPSSLPYLVFVSKVSHWIKTFQVEKKYQRETFWNAFLAYYKRDMKPEEEKKLLELYPP